MRLFLRMRVGVSEQLQKSENEIITDQGVKKTRNRFEIAPQAMILSAGVIMSIIFISIMVAQFEKAQKMSAAVSEKMIKAGEEIANGDIMQYDGITLTGADVRNFYRKYFSQNGSEVMKMTVNNGKTTSDYTASGSYPSMTDPGGNKFIKPDDLYKCSVTVNKNGIITKVSFTRK